MFLNNVLVCFIGDSQSGKSKLMMELEKRSGDRIRIVRSVTTRNIRPGESGAVYRKFYFQTSEDSFKEYIRLERFIEWDEYAGNFYGTPHEALESVLSQTHAMLAVTEKTIPHLQNLGLNIMSIQIIGVNGPKSKNLLRQKADAERRGTVTPDYVVFNDFSPGGFKKSCSELMRIMEPYIMEI